MPITVHPLSPAIAAEIRGADISGPLDPQDIAAITQAWLDHCVLLFRDQSLDPNQQRAFVRNFGELGGRKARVEPQNYRKPDEETAGPDYNADSMLVTNIRDAAQPRELSLFHRSAEPRRRHDLRQYVRSLHAPAATFEGSD